MAVNANTVETYDSSLIREDLQETYSMISPEKTPFISTIGSTTCDSTLFEWPVVELAAVDSSNRVAEGEASPPNDSPNLGLRLSNYTQISDKVVEVSHTSQAVNGAANNVQRLATQLVLKMKEMKRDKETMLLSNVAATAASSGNPRSTAGLPAFLRTNTDFTTGGANPTLSGGTEGFPNAPATEGTASAIFAEAQLNDLMEQIWTEGGEPTLVMVNSGNKRRVSSAFTGNATRYKDTVDKNVVAGIDFYDTDFGEVTMVPNRFQPTNNPGTDNDSYNIFFLDPNFASIAYLDPVQQKPLAETGHSMRTLMWCEYGLQVDNEKAHGIIRDTTNAVS